MVLRWVILKIGSIIASTNPYALDYICAKVINLNPNLVNTIVQSEKEDYLIIMKLL